MASFFVIRGQDHGRNFSVSGDSATIGRDSQNHIRLNDSEVSRLHAKISRTAEADFELHDCDSSNGTFVNSQKIKSIVLRSGDRVQLGRTLMIFTVDTEAQGERLADQNAPLAHQVEILAPQTGELSQIRSRADSLLPSKSLQPLLYSSTEELAKGNSSTGSFVLKKSIPEFSDEEIVYQVSQAIRRTIDITELLGKVLDLIFQWIECDRGCVLLHDEITGGLRPACTRVRKQEEKSTQRPLQISRSILDHVMQHREGVLTSNAQDDSRWNQAASIAGLGIREAICVPMLGRYGMQGAIYVDTEMSPGSYIQRNGKCPFDDRHLKLMISIAGQAALAIEDTQFYSAMLQSERLATMGQTIANLSHHVKNILQGISGGNFLVEDGLHRHDLSVIERGWTIVRRNQDRISRLVMDMLSFSKERSPDLQSFDINQLVSEVIELAQVRADELGVRLAVRLLPTSLCILLDNQGIQHALLNVVNNAIEAAAASEREPSTDASVQVSVELDSDGQRIAIGVEDNGDGIPVEQLDWIFTPFNSSKGSRGTGLGLPVSQKILREHGGDIQVTSQIDQGSKFTLVWPLEFNANPPTLID